MSPDTGEIIFAPNDEIRRIEKDQGVKLIPLSKELADELEPMGARRRKNFMRNKPCICGSGAKFKRCCWNKYGKQQEVG